MSDDEYYLKVNAEAHIDELAQISERGKEVVTDEGGKHGPLAKDGWNYRTAYFQDFDGRYYRLRISVAQGEDGKVVYNIGNIKERSFPTIDGSSAKGGALHDGKTPSVERSSLFNAGSSAEGGAQSDQKTPFKDSISQGGEKSNSKLLPEGTEELEVEEDAYQDPLVREIWRVFGKDRPAEEEDRPYRSDDPIIQAIVDLDRSTRFARKEGTDSGLVFDEYVRTTLPCGMAERINTLAKTFGVRVRFADEVENGQANASISGREILVEKNNKNPVLFLLGHEWIHRVQDLAPREYRAFREAIGEELYSRAEEVLALYERQGRSISYEQALDEAAADYAGRMLEDGRLLDEFIERHRTDRNLLERFMEAIRELIGKLTGKEKARAETAEGKLKAALEAAAKQAERNGTAATEGGGVRFSLKEFVDGRRFVDVDTDQGRFDGLSEKEMGYEARRVIKEKFLGKVIGLNNKVFVNGNTAEEYGRPQRRLAKEEYMAKMRAATELDNLLDAGTNFRTEPDGRDGHIHSKAVGDFRYFDTIFKVGGEYYSGIVNIMPVAKGLLLKDITQIRNITQDIRASYGDNPLGRFLRDASMDSISQGKGKSNRKLLPEGTGEPEGKEDTYQDPLVREVWRVFGKDRPAEEEDRPYRSDDPIIQAIVDLDRSTRFARREGTDSGLVFDEYVRTTLPCGMAERINTLAKIFGVRVRFADEVENGQANASISGREILVEKNNKNPVLFLLGHEWIHRVQDLAPREYRAFREAIGEELYSRAEEVRALYERQGRSISYEQALNEAAADYAGRMLEDGRVLDEFIERHRGDRTVLERFAEAIRELIGVLTGKEKTQAQRVERKLRAAMEAAAKQTERSGTAATESGGVRLSLKEFVDGRRFVDVDTDQGRFDGLSEKEMGQQARKVIKEKFKGRVIGLENRAFVNGETAKEYGYPEKKLSPLEHEAKMRASTELDNLLDAGTNFRTEPDGRDGHIHSKAVGDFRYFDTIFKVGGEYYSGIVNIMPVAKGLLLKDITQIRNITQDIHSSYGENPLATFLRDASMDSISQGEGKSNRKMLPEDTEEPEGKEDTYQDPLVREIWRVFGKDRPEE